MTDVLLQMALIIMAMVTAASSVRNLQAKLGLPLRNQVVGWVVLVVSAMLPFFHLPKHRTISSRVMTYFLGFGPCFVILSISVEGMFYSAYSVTLVMWILVEGIVRKHRAAPMGVLSPAVPSSASTMSNSSSDGGKESQTKSGGYRFQLDDLRIALFFLFFVQVGFFGTGKWVVLVGPSWIMLSADQRDLVLLRSRIYLTLDLCHCLLNILQIVLSGTCLSADTQV